jgi:hypothetical protein
MHLDTFKDLYKIESNILFKDEYLKSFALAYLNSNQSSKYKLYHQYLFRSDVWIPHIQQYSENVYTPSGELNLEDEKIRRKIDECSHIFVGYVKLKYAKKYSELFLSIHYHDAWRNEPACYNICGYSVCSHIKRYDYMFENEIALGYRDLNLPIIIEDDIGKQLIRWHKKLKNKLNI